MLKLADGALCRGARYGVEDVICKGRLILPKFICITPLACHLYQFFSPNLCNFLAYLYQQITAGEHQTSFDPLGTRWTICRALKG